MKKRSKLQWVGLTLTSVGVALSSGAALANLHVSSKGGLTVLDPNDSTYWFKIGGRLHLDQTLFSGDADDKRSDYPSGANVRRAWVDFNGGVGDCLSYLLRLDMRGDTTSNSVMFQEAYLSYSGFAQNSSVAVGQFGLPFGLENWSSTNDLMFLEPSLMTSTFSWVPEPGLYTDSTDTATTTTPYYGIPPSSGLRGLGLYGDIALCNMFTIAAAVTQPPSGSSTTLNTGRNDRWTWSARVTYSPVHTHDRVYHFGLSARSQSINHERGGAAIRDAILATTPEAVARTKSDGRSTTAYLVNTGFMRAKHAGFWGAELAGLWGPFTAQAEYNTARFTREDAASTPKGNVSFHGWHVQMGYMLTGESRRYDWESATFGSPKACAPCGAWELAARYSYVNLNDKQVYGGSQHNASLGINWFYNENVTLKANYIRAIIHPIGATAGTIPSALPAIRKLNIFAVRLQVAF